MTGLAPDFLAGRVALVTGAGRGIGLEVARTLADHGASVIVNDLDEETAAAGAAAVGRGAAGIAADVTSADGPETVVNSALERFGRLDVIVNNAGYTWDGAMHKMSDEQFEAMVAVHLVAPFRILRAAAPHLRESARRDLDAGEEVFRKVVNVSSTSGVMGNPGQANYAAGKAGVIGLTKTLAREWGRLRINVNAVAFGFVDTRLTKPRDESEVFRGPAGDIGLGVPSHVRESIIDSIPLGRLPSAAEVAGGVAFLCSPWSNFVHGQVLNVTGGQVTGMST